MELKKDIRIEDLKMAFEFQMHIPEEWSVKDVFAINIPMSSFAANVSPNFGDIRSEHDDRLLLYFFLQMLHQEKLGTVMGGNPWFCKPNTPKTKILIEELISEPEKGKSVEIVGIRFWGIVLDEKYNPGEAANIGLFVNSKIIEKTKKLDAHHWEMANLKSLSNIVSKVYLPYFSKLKDHQPFFGIDIHNAVLDIKNLIKEDGVFHPKKFFDPFYAIQHGINIENFSNDVCSKQRIYSNYFTLDKVFKKSFALPQLITGIATRNSAFESLTRYPLPSTIWKNFPEKIKELETYMERASGETTEELEEFLDINDVQVLNDLEAAFPEILKPEFQDQMGLSDLHCKNKMLERNIFMKLKVKNSEELSEIRRSYPQVESEQFRTSMKKYRQKSTKDTFRLFFDQDVKEKTESIKLAVQWYKGLPIDQKWVEHRRIWGNLSGFGNTIVMNQCNLDKFMKSPIEVNFQLMHLTFYCTLTSFEFGWELRPNLIIAGDGGKGKSHVLDKLEKMVSPGGLMVLGHTTNQAFNTDLDYSDTGVISHEAPIELLGIDQKGKQMNANTSLKDRLAKQYSATLAFKHDEATGRRLAELHVSRAMMTHIFASNDILPPDESAQMQRFITWHMMKISRDDRPENAQNYYSKENENVLAQEMVSRFFQLASFYQLIWYKMIESSALPDIDDECALIIGKMVFDYLNEHYGIKHPSHRVVKMFLMICRSIHMNESIHKEFFSETGKHHREDANGNPKDLTSEDFLDLVKYGAVTEEVAVFALSLLENILVPKFRTQVCNGIIKNTIKLKDPKNINQQNFDFEKFRKVVKNQGDQKQKIEIDYDYVCFYVANDMYIYSEIVKATKMNPSINNVKTEVEKLKSEQMVIRKRALNKDSVVYETKEKVSKPVVIIDNDPQSYRSRRFSILIDALTENVGDYENIFLRAVETVLSYDNQLKQNYITSMPYTRIKIDPKTKKEKIQCFPSLLALAKVKNDPERTIKIENPYALTPSDLNQLYASKYTWSDQALLSIPTYALEPVYELDMHLDEFCFKKYCRKVGLDPNDTKNNVAIPFNHCLAVAIQRKSHEYDLINKRMYQKYPLEKLIEMQSMYHKISNGITTQKISSMLNTNSVVKLSELMNDVVDEIKVLSQNDEIRSIIDEEKSKDPSKLIGQNSMIPKKFVDNKLQNNYSLVSQIYISNLSDKEIQSKKEALKKFKMESGHFDIKKYQGKHQVDDEDGEDGEEDRDDTPPIVPVAPLPNGKNKKDHKELLDETSNFMNDLTDEDLTFKPNEHSSFTYVSSQSIDLSKQNIKKKDSKPIVAEEYMETLTSRFKKIKTSSMSPPSSRSASPRQSSSQESPNPESKKQKETTNSSESAKKKQKVSLHSSKEIPNECSDEDKKRKKKELMNDEFRRTPLEHFQNLYQKSRSYSSGKEEEEEDTGLLKSNQSHVAKAKPKIQYKQTNVPMDVVEQKSKKDKSMEKQKQIVPVAKKAPKKKDSTQEVPKKKDLEKKPQKSVFDIDNDDDDDGHLDIIHF